MPLPFVGVVAAQVVQRRLRQRAAGIGIELQHARRIGADGGPGERNAVAGRVEREDRARAVRGQLAGGSPLRVGAQRAMFGIDLKRQQIAGPAAAVEHRLVDA